MTPAAFIKEAEEPKRLLLTALDKLIVKSAPRLERYVHDDKFLAYGPTHLKYASGREVDWFQIGMQATAVGVSVYVSCEENGKYLAEAHAKQLGKVSVGKSCIRIKKLDDLNLEVFAQVVAKAAAGGQ